MSKFGIDISVWQSGFNFDKAVSEGVEFVILRGAYHMSKDKCFEDFYKECQKRQLPVGVYHYSMAKTVASAKEEAKFLIENVLKGKKFDYPIYMDVEDKVQRALGKKLLTEIIIAFCETLEDAGYYVGIYSTASFLKSYTYSDQLECYDKWIAQWAKKCSYTGHYGLWQFGGETNVLRSNKVAGVTCDQDYAYKDYPAIMESLGLNGYGQPSKVVLKSIDVIAQEVIDGKWDAGAARKAALKNAGYDYAEVQSKVNEILQNNRIEKAAKDVIYGKYGNGIVRTTRLKLAGYSSKEIKAIQKRVNELM